MPGELLAHNLVVFFRIRCRWRVCWQEKFLSRRCLHDVRATLGLILLRACMLLGLPAHSGHEGAGEAGVDFGRRLLGRLVDRLRLHARAPIMSDLIRDKRWLHKRRPGAHKVLRLEVSISGLAELCSRWIRLG